MSPPTPSNRILGINRTQDASICLIQDGRIVVSIQKERLTRRKHDWGARGDLGIYLDRIAALREPVDLVVESYSSDAELAHLAEYRAELMERVRFRGAPRVELVSHHLTHAYSAFYPSPFPRAAAMVMDFMGSPVDQMTEAWPGRALAPAGNVEVASFYVCERGAIKCIAKQLWNKDRSRPVGLGCFYFFLTQTMFKGDGNEGKVMGLSALARADELTLPPLSVDGLEVFIPDEWLAAFADERFGFFRLGRGTFEDCARLAAAGQKAFEDALLLVARHLKEQTGEAALCFAGGTALNCVANGRLFRESAFADLFIPPAPHDGGTALGAAVYGAVEMGGDLRAIRWTTDYLGPEAAPEDVGALVAGADELTFSEPADLCAAIFDELERGCVLALWQGRSELGPRALGHRSILADPRSPEIRAWINQHVKGREWFRPLAPMVLVEDAPTYFDFPAPSPFMLFAGPVREVTRTALPAVVHADGTARLQTVSAEDDPFVHRLLTHGKARTGHGVLLNTSFNGPSEPIVETRADAVKCLRETKLHGLIMPPYLVLKIGRPTRPGSR